MHSLVTTHAAAADITQMNAWLHGEEREVFGDQAYWRKRIGSGSARTVCGTA
jgi:IS5 family transposase